jgi:hypothetical protein
MVLDLLVQQEFIQILDEEFIQKPKPNKIGNRPSQKLGCRHWKTPGKLEHGSRITHSPNHIVSVDNKIPV